jgi:ribonuclease Z
VGTLVLTHMVPPVQPGAEQEWIDQAQGEFGGTVVLAEDLTSVEAGPAVQ